MEKISKELYETVLERVIDIRVNGFKEKSPNVPKTLPVGPVIGEERTIPTSEGDILIYYHNPRNLKNAPLYVNFHGGGMAAGSAQQDEFICGAIAKDIDVVVVNVEYPLAPEHPYPHGVNASYDVVNYISKNAEAFDIDADRIAMGGYSAGGCVAAAVALLCNRKKEFTYKGITACYPGFDFETPNLAAENGQIDNTSDVYGYAYFADGGDLKDPIASPTKADEEELKDIPSALVMTGEIDPLRPHGETFAAKLARANVPFTYKQFKNCAHGFTHRGYKTEPGEAISLTEDYLQYIFTK